MLTKNLFAKERNSTPLENLVGQTIPCLISVLWKSDDIEEVFAMAIEETVTCIIQIQSGVDGADNHDRGRRSKSCIFTHMWKLNDKDW